MNRVVTQSLQRELHFEAIWQIIEKQIEYNLENG
jgi:hypothetical protein